MITKAKQAFLPWPLSFPAVHIDRYALSELTKLVFFSHGLRENACTIGRIFPRKTGLKRRANKHHRHLPSIAFHLSRCCAIFTGCNHGTYQTRGRGPGSFIFMCTTCHVNRHLHLHSFLFSLRHNFLQRRGSNPLTA